jgi:hypothetical protein
MAKHIVKTRCISLPVPCRHPGRLCLIRAGGRRHFYLASIYFYDSGHEDAHELNSDLIHMVLHIIQNLDGPALLAADWNMEPDAALLDPLRSNGCNINATPEPTCFANISTPKTLDYFVNTNGITTEDAVATEHWCNPHRMVCINIHRTDPATTKLIKSYRMPVGEAHEAWQELPLREALAIRCLTNHGLHVALDDNHNLETHWSKWCHAAEDYLTKIMLPPELEQDAGRDPRATTRGLGPHVREVSDTGNFWQKARSHNHPLQDDTLRGAHRCAQASAQALAAFRALREESQDGEEAWKTRKLHSIRKLIEQEDLTVEGPIFADELWSEANIHRAYRKAKKQLRKSRKAQEKAWADEQFARLETINATNNHKDIWKTLKSKDPELRPLVKDEQGNMVGTPREAAQVYLNSWASFWLRQDHTQAEDFATRYLQAYPAPPMPDITVEDVQDTLAKMENRKSTGQDGWSISSSYLRALGAAPAHWQDRHLRPPPARRRHSEAIRVSALPGRLTVEGLGNASDPPGPSDCQQRLGLPPSRAVNPHACPLAQGCGRGTKPSSRSLGQQGVPWSEIQCENTTLKSFKQHNQRRSNVLL